MTDEPGIWRDAGTLAALAHSWDRRLRGRKVDRLGGGPGWLRLSLVPEREDAGSPVQLFLCARPGAVLCWDAVHSPAPSVLDALGRVRQRRLTVAPHLLGATLTGAGSPPKERILCLRFHAATGDDLELRQQLFAQRGNLVLVDTRQRRLWAAHAFPHQILLQPIPAFATVPAGCDPDAVAAAAREQAPPLLTARLAAEVRSHAETDLRRRSAFLRKLQDRLLADLANAENGDLWRRYAETLAIHLHTLAKGAEEAILASAEGDELRIPLDPALPPHRNMERWFKRARKAKRGRETIAARLRETRERLTLLGSAREELGDGDDAAALTALAAWRERHADLLVTRRKARGVAGGVEVQRPFRRHIVAGRWDVWVGRSAAENDTLTHRASAGQDWWFHAQGVPGSHVVLRTGGCPERVPKTVLNSVAAIAAWYSKSRDSALVPVIYTLRKYVRKPRKSPPGTAVCSREKSLMVEPGLPPDEPGGGGGKGSSQ